MNEDQQTDSQEPAQRRESRTEHQSKWRANFLQGDPLLPIGSYVTDYEK